MSVESGFQMMPEGVHERTRLGNELRAAMQTGAVTVAQLSERYRLPPYDIEWLLRTKSEATPPKSARSGPGSAGQIRFQDHRDLMEAYKRASTACAGRPDQFMSTASGAIFAVMLHLLWKQVQDLPKVAAAARLSLRQARVLCAVVEAGELCSRLPDWEPEIAPVPAEPVPRIGARATSPARPPGAKPPAVLVRVEEPPVPRPERPTSTPSPQPRAKPPAPLISADDVQELTQAHIRAWWASSGRTLDVTTTEWAILAGMVWWLHHHDGRSCSEIRKAARLTMTTVSRGVRMFDRAQLSEGEETGL